MKVTDFDFTLPESLIALTPQVPRDSCRLLVLHRNGRDVEDRRFYELPEILSEGDLLLLNNTRVFPARLAAKKETGGKIDILLVRALGPDTWEVLSKGRYTGKIKVSDALSGEIVNGTHLKFEGAPLPAGLLEKVGQMPLPPYIRRMPAEADKEWYQTVYAAMTGSIAAPTAGLHFTNDLIARLGQKGVLIRFLTLHVGTGTFKPLKAEHVADHRMDREYFETEADLLDTISAVKQKGKKIIAVGTTTTRAIEGLLSGNYAGDHGGTRINGGAEGRRKICGYTDIFIYPGYRFKAVDSLVTNFHLPASTPLMLTSAMCGKEKLMAAYRHAIAAGYSFFSYGDAMLIL